MKYRPATLDDAEVLYAWRRDKSAQQNSLNSDDFSFESHVAWLTRSLKSSEREILIFFDDQKKLGMGRSDWDGKHYTLSWSIGVEFRGKGYGKQLVSLLLEQFVPARAVIKSSNKASLQIVESLDFELEKTEHGVQYFLFRG